MESQQGFSLTELLVVLFIASLLITATIAYTLPMLGREDLRSAAYEIQSHLQLARAQSVARNRSCRFILNDAARRIQVIDLNDPFSGTDDITLAAFTLPPTLSFARPDPGSPITLAFSLGAYQATFAADGSVSSGAGEIVIRGGDRYDRLTLYGAGGARVDRWDGSAWVSGS